MNALTLQGHAPAVASVRTFRSRALRAVNVRKMCARAVSLARRKFLTIAAISAISCYAGALLGYDPLTYTAAFAALGSLCLADKSRKGGVA